MNFTTREDIEAPIDHVWASVTDLEALERLATRRGITVRRSDPPGGPGLQTEWHLEFSFRGKPREVEARITRFEPPDTIDVDSTSGGVACAARVELVPLSPRRTRLQITLDLAATNLAARLLLQSLKFARATVQKRFEARVGNFADTIAGRYRQAG